MDRLLRVRNWQRAINFETVDQLQKLETQEKQNTPEESSDESAPSDLEQDLANEIYSTSAEELSLPKQRKLVTEAQSSINGKHPSKYKEFLEIQSQASQNLEEENEKKLQPKPQKTQKNLRSNPKKFKKKGSE